MFVASISTEAKGSDVTVAVQGNFAKKTKMLIALQHEIMIIIKTTFHILRIFCEIAGDSNSFNACRGFFGLSNNNWK